ncbi:putative ribonuclease H-like domain-containing protein [Tanacetum coccineum]
MFLNKNDKNRVIIVKPHNKTPYELFRGKFDGKSDDGFFAGYSLTTKAFRVYNIRTRKVEENLHIRFLENKPIVTGDGPKWLFDIDSLTKSMNYVPVVADGSMFDSSSKNSSDDEPQPSSNAEKKDDEGVSKASGFSDQEQPESSTPNINTVGPSINTASANFKTGSLNINTVSPTVITTRSNRSQNVSDMFSLGRSATLEATHADLFGDETEMDMSNLTTSYQVPTTPNTRIHKDHSLDHVIGDIQSGVQTRGMTKNTNEHGFISAVYEGKTHEDLHTCLFACFLSQEEPKRIAKALSDPAWVEAMQEELLQFKLQKVWILVDLPKGKRAIGTKWIFRNKKDERGIVTRNKARLVAQGYTQEEVHEEEVYVCQPPGFEDPDYPEKVYKVVKALYGLHQALRAWYETLAKYLLELMGFIKWKDRSRIIYRNGSMGGRTQFLLRKFVSQMLGHAKHPIWIPEKPFAQGDSDNDGCDVQSLQINDWIIDVFYLIRSLTLVFAKFSLWNLVGISDSDYTRASLDLGNQTTGRSWVTEWKRAATTASSLKVEQDSGNNNRTQSMATLNEPSPYGTSSGSGPRCQDTILGGVNAQTRCDLEITATIDEKVKVVSEASIRRHLKLEDSDGISTLPTTEIFEQLALMGLQEMLWNNFSSNISNAIHLLGSTIPVDSHHTPTVALSTSQPHHLPTLKDFIKQETEVPQPSSPTQTHVADAAAFTSVDDRHGGAATTVSGLEAGHGNGNIHKTPIMPYDLPLPRVHTLESDEGRMQPNELMELVTKLSDIVAILENNLNRQRKPMVLLLPNLSKRGFFQSGEEIDGIDKDLNISLVQQMIHHDAQTQGRQEYDLKPNFEFTASEEVYTTKPDISTANVPVSTAGAEVSTAAERLVYIRRSAAIRKDNEAQRLQEKFDEEERQRIASVHEEASTFKPKEWDNIQAQIEADEELAHMLQAQERERYSEADKAKLPIELINERKRQFDLSHRLNKVLFEATVKRVNTFTPIESDDTVPKVVARSSKRSAEEEHGEESSKRQNIGEGSEPSEESKDKESDELSQEQLQQLIIIVPEEGVYQFFEDMLKNFDRDNLMKLWDLVRERFSSTEPTNDKERALWVELKRLFEPDTDDLLELQRYMHDPLTWRLYDTCSVHHVSIETGLDIFMLVEKDYPLTRGLPMLMLVNKLQVDQHSEMAYELLRKIFILANRPRH